MRRVVHDGSMSPVIITYVSLLLLYSEYLYMYSHVVATRYDIDTDQSRAVNCAATSYTSAREIPYIVYYLTIEDHLLFVAAVR